MVRREDDGPRDPQSRDESIYRRGHDDQVPDYESQSSVICFEVKVNVGWLVGYPLLRLTDPNLMGSGRVG